TFALDISSRLDLAEVDRALPGLLEFQAGQAIRTGIVRVADVEIRGGETPTVTGMAELIDLTVSRGGVSDPIAPMRVDLAAAVNPSEGVQVEALNVASGFGMLRASGNPRNLTCQFEGD